MNESIIRTLRADEIECRVAVVNEKGVSLLLFKDARVDQKILDETFTPFGWKRSHQTIDGCLYCTVEVWDDEKQQWIAKQDVGTESYSEKEKGQASDSFKRACVNWGIGRELYASPFIWIPASRVTLKQRNDGKYQCSDHFSVSRIVYDENRVICDLAIVNDKNETVYEMKQGRKAAAKKSSVENSSRQKGISLEQIASMEEELKRTGVPLRKVLDRYHLSTLDDMTEETYENAMTALNKTGDRNINAA